MAYKWLGLTVRAYRQVPREPLQTEDVEDHHQEDHEKWESKWKNEGASRHNESGAKGKTQQERVFFSCRTAVDPSVCARLFPRNPYLRQGAAPRKPQRLREGNAAEIRHIPGAKGKGGPGNHHERGSSQKRAGRRNSYGAHEIDCRHPIPGDLPVKRHQNAGNKREARTKPRPNLRVSNCDAGGRQGKAQSEKKAGHHMIAPSMCVVPRAV